LDLHFSDFSTIFNGKIAILAPQLCFKGQRRLSTFKTVNLVPKFLLLDHNHPSVDAALHEADIKSLFYPCFFSTLFSFHLRCRRP
jgi:hypothetical protein